MASQPVFNIQRLYLKKAVFEQPNSPALLIEQEQPTVEISLNVAVEPITQRPNIHEITVDATVQAKLKDKILFMADCRQSGLFEILNVTDAQLDQILNVICPQIIYPYLRSNVTDLIVRGGFTPVHIAEINFRAMHEQRKAQQRAGQGQENNTSQPQIQLGSSDMIRAALQRAQERGTAQIIQANQTQATQTADPVSQKKKKKSSS